MRNRSLLLLGPTGSGKTPLGELFQREGLGPSRCLHFDFGENLRRIVKRDRPDEQVSRGDIEFLKQVLRCGVLLEDDKFPIAERVLRSFLAERGANGDTIVVLNGLPRHVGQAAAICSSLDVRHVVWLRCTSETVLARIRGNSGGDRTGRADDDLDSVARKLVLFEERTLPLVDYYRSHGARIITLEVTAEMSAEDMRSLLSL